MSKYVTMEEDAIKTLCGAVKKLNSVSDAIDDSGILQTTTTWSNVKIDQEIKKVTPTIVEDENNDDETYKLNITTKDGTITTPNLKGENSEKNFITNLEDYGIDSKDTSLTVSASQICNVKTASLLEFGGNHPKFADKPEKAGTNGVLLYKPCDNVDSLDEYDYALLIWYDYVDGKQYMGIYNSEENEVVWKGELALTKDVITLSGGELNKDASIIIHDSDNDLKTTITAGNIDLTNSGIGGTVKSNDVCVSWITGLNGKTTDDIDFGSNILANQNVYVSGSLKVSGKDVVHAGDNNENTTINLPSKDLGASITIKDDYLTTSMYADGLYVEDSDSGNNTSVGANGITTPLVNGYTMFKSTNIDVADKLTNDAYTGTSDPYFHIDIIQMGSFVALKFIMYNVTFSSSSNMVLTFDGTEEYYDLLNLFTPLSFVLPSIVNTQGPTVGTIYMNGDVILIRNTSQGKFTGFTLKFPNQTEDKTASGYPHGTTAIGYIK